MSTNQDFFYSGLNAQSVTKAVADAILTNYNKGLRPICPGEDMVNATLGVALRQIVHLVRNVCSKEK